MWWRGPWTVTSLFELCGDLQPRCQQLEGRTNSSYIPAFPSYQHVQRRSGGGKALPLWILQRSGSVSLPIAASFVSRYPNSFATASCWWGPHVQTLTAETWSNAFGLHKTSGLKLITLRIDVGQSVLRHFFLWLQVDMRSLQRRFWDWTLQTMSGRWWRDEQPCTTAMTSVWLQIWTLETSWHHNTSLRTLRKYFRTLCWSQL